jgi:hypothetical protein
MKLPAVIGRSKKVERVRDGRVERRKCPQCGKTAEFEEVVVSSKWTAYVVVSLWNSESSAFRCRACEEVMDLDDTEEPELTPKELEQRRKLAEKQQRIDAKAAEVARRQAAAEAADQEQAVDDELAAMKKRLGID